MLQLFENCSLSATEKVVRKKKEATEKSTEVEQNRKQITVEQEEAEEALRQALPDLENARDALDTLQKKDITEIRAFANPPEPVQIICECVAVLKVLHFSNSYSFFRNSFFVIKLIFLYFAGIQGNFLEDSQDYAF